MKWIIMALFILSAAYVQFRGKVRFKKFHRLVDYTLLSAPINVFMYVFSKVPNTPYLSTDDFPELKKLQENWRLIANEAMQLHDSGEIKASAKYDDLGFKTFFRRGWKRFYLKWYDSSHPSAKDLCPATTQLLNEIPSVKAAMFAELPPGGRLGLHRDPYAGSLRYHLGLVTPNDDECYILVDGEKYSWRDGESVVFDETYLHTAENKTDKNRIILFCDVERPMRFRWAQRVNYWIGRYLVSAASAPNSEADKTGVLNRLFKYWGYLHEAGRRLKAWNSRVYYAVKWTLFAILIILIFHLY